MSALTEKSVKALIWAALVQANEANYQLRLENEELRASLRARDFEPAASTSYTPSEDTLKRIAIKNHNRRMAMYTTTPVTAEELAAHRAGQHVPGTGANTTMRERMMAAKAEAMATGKCVKA